MIPGEEDVDPGASAGHTHVRTGLILSLIQAGGLLFVVGQDVIAARLFGARPEMDGYLGAWIVPSTIATVFGAGIQNALIPHFARARTQKGSQVAWDLAGESIVVAVGFFLVVAALGILAEPLVLRVTANGAGAGALVASRQVYPIGFLCAGISLSLAMLAGVSAAVGRFLMPALLANLTAALPMLSVWLLGGRIGIVALPLGLLCSAFAQALILLLVLRSLGLRLRLPRPGLVGRQWPVLRDGVAVALASIPLAGILISERAFGSALGEGSVSHLAYSAKLVSASIRCLSAGLVVMGLPLLSAYLARGERHRFETAFSLLWRVALYLAAAAIVGLAVGGEPLVRLIFQRGRFESVDTLVVAKNLPWYSLSLIYGLGFPPLNAILLASGKAKHLPALNLLGLSTYMGLGWLNARLFGLETVGLSLAYGVSLDLIVLATIVFLVHAKVVRSGEVLQAFVRAASVFVLIGAPIWVLRALIEGRVPLPLEVGILLVGGVGVSAVAVALVDREVYSRVLKAVKGTWGETQTTGSVVTDVGVPP